MRNKPIVWLHTDVKTPPFSVDARINAGFLLRELQSGIMLEMPDSRPMPSIGSRCHELRIIDSAMAKTWRIVYRVDPDAIIIAEVFVKTTQKTPQKVMTICKKRLKEYDRITSF